MGEFHTRETDDEKLPGKWLWRRLILNVTWLTEAAQMRRWDVGYSELTVAAVTDVTAEVIVLQSWKAVQRETTTGKNRTSGDALWKEPAKVGIVTKFFGKNERSIASSASRELFVFRVRVSLYRPDSFSRLASFCLRPRNKTWSLRPGTTEPLKLPIHCWRAWVLCLWLEESLFWVYAFS